MAINRIETTLSNPKILFRLLPADQAEWLSSDGMVRRGTLADMAGQIDSGPLILVVPGEAAMLHRVHLPSQRRSTWSKAVPYALEDQVVPDVETLHYAFGSSLDGDHIPVAVVGHDTLRGWLNQCSLAGLTPVAMVPEPLLLPWFEGSWSVILEPDRAIVRSGRWEGFAAERDLLELLLNQALAEAGDAKPEQIRVWGGSLPALAEAGVEIRYEEDSVEPLQLFATVYPSARAINLLQGIYSRQAQWDRWLRPCRNAAIIAGLWLLVQGVGQIHEYWSLVRELAILRAETDRVFKDGMPGVTRIVNPRVQMETRLRELRPANVSGSLFLELLFQGGQPLTLFPAITLRSFSYRDGQLDFDLEGGNPAVLDQLRQQFNQQIGLQAEIRTTQREGQIDSKVTLKRARS